MRTRIFLQDGTVRCLLWAWVFVFAVLVVSTGVVGVYLLFAAHGHIHMFIGVLCERVDIGGMTAVWYILAFSFLGVGWRLTRRIQVEQWRILIRTGLVAALLAPGVSPDTQLQAWLVLPALVHTLRCVFLRGLWCALSFWPIPTIWFMGLFVSLVFRCCQLKSKEKGL